LKSVFTEEYQSFLSTLVQARINAGLTQTDIANSLGRPQSFVSKYERGERRLDVIEFVAVARILGLTASDVIATVERQLHLRSREAK